MNFKKIPRRDLEEMFETFLSSIDDYIENILEISAYKGYNLDFSLESLSDLEKYISTSNINADDDRINDLAAYLGEVIRKNIGGNWKCSLDLKCNSIFYGKPVIAEYTTPNDLEFSPFDCILNYISEPHANYFINIIENDLDDVPLNLDDIPTEE